MYKLSIEKAFLAVFVVLILYFGPGNAFDHSLYHPYPYGYFASDAFQHQVRADAIKDIGNFRYDATYISKGYEDIVGRYPPALYHVTVIFSDASGMQVYDSIYFIVLLSIVLASIVMFLLISEFNKNVALLSLPFFVLAFTFPLSVGFLFGHWPSILSQLFLVTFFWCVSKIELRYSSIFLSVIFTAILMTHTSEAAFAVVFLALYFAVMFFAKKLKFRDIKMLILSFTISLIVSLYYLIIFYQTFGVSQAYTFTVEPKWDGNPGFYIADFGLLLIPLALGIILAIIKISQSTALIASLAMLVGGFLNYAGFTFRSFQIRFLWPIYLSVLFALGIYFALSFLKKPIRDFAMMGSTLILAFLLFGVFNVSSILQYSNSKVSGSGSMNQYHWNLLNWISSTTEKNSKIYFFYGDIYSQDSLLRNSKRLHAQVDPEDFLNALNEHKIKKEYMTEIPGDNGGGMKFWNGGISLKMVDENSTAFGPRNICNYDYFVLDKVTSQKPLSDYNMLIAKKLSDKGATIVYENEVAIVLKNNDVKGDCIVEGSF